MSYWKTPWDKLTARERRDARLFMQEVAGWFDFQIYFHKVCRPEDFHGGENLSVGGVTGLEKRAILLFTHQSNKNKSIKAFLVYEILSTFFHELGHAWGLELGSPYERKMIEEALTNDRLGCGTVLESASLLIAGETLAELRGKFLANLFMPDMPYNYSYTMQVFEHTMAAWGWDDAIFGPDVTWKKLYKEMSMRLETTKEKV